jgi:superfamily II DNA or RNA helicase
MNLDLFAVEELVGAPAFQRGAPFAREGRVSALRWDPDAEVISGTVQGNGGRYGVELNVTQSGDRITVEEGECSCPVGWNCKHAAAVAIVAARWDPPAPEPVDVPSPATSTSPSTWSAPLLEMLAERGPPAEGTPLAIELALQLPSAAQRIAAPQLLARLMRPGARGGWVNGSLSWGSISSWDTRHRDLRPDHLEVASAFGDVLRARQTAGGRYWYGSSGDGNMLDLTDWSEEQLWPLLARAERAGMQLIHAIAGVGEVPALLSGELFLDVSANSVGAEIRPRLELTDRAGQLRLAGPESVPISFLGELGHGLILAEPPAGETSAPSHGTYRNRRLMAARLRFVRLARDTPAQFQQMVLESSVLTVPPEEIADFSTRYAPLLRHIAPVRSVDASFSAPEVLGPRLLLSVTHGEAMLTAAAWKWRYEVGENYLDVELRSDGSPLRDADAEAAVLARTGLADLGAGPLVDQDGRPVAGTTILTGLEAAAFTDSVLTALGDRDDIDVLVEGIAPDYRAVDDSLEITVSTQSQPDRSDWFDLNVTISAEGSELPFSEVFGALARGEERMLLSDGAHFSLLRPELDQLRQLIEEARALGEGSTGNSMRISRYQAGLWRELVEIGVVAEQAAGWQRAVDDLLALDELPDVPLPPGIEADLRPYQREGFAWLATLWRLGLGGILADDMGLGKTLQALALICHARTDTSPPFLVVAPTSVVSNWVVEAARFAPGLTVRPMTDTLARARTDIDALREGADVVVTTYNLVRLNAVEYGGRPWAGLILDEAQAVKNHNAKAHAVVRHLQAPFKLAISGTPLENNVMELWSLLSIVAPGLFPNPETFKTHYQQRIERDGDRERLAVLRRRIRPLMLRRRKEIVAAELPAKQEQMVAVELVPRHRKIYDQHLQRERQRLLGLLDDFGANRFSILTGITKLRQLSLHAGLVDPADLSVPSAKIEALSERLDDVIAGGHRALVFSQFTGFLGLVRAQLDAQGIAYAYLDGRTRGRGKVIERFKTGDAPVFLISLKAGGFGLNLTEADYCFLLDPWWNPATEAQAIDRTHRIGQTRQVMVYRLVSAGTIEEKVMALARRKAELFASVIDDGDVFSAAVTAEDIRGLLAG